MTTLTPYPAPAPRATLRPRPVKRQTELSALTGLRFFAAFYVVIYHFISTSIPKSLPYLVNLFSVGYIAVGLFFLLSGFVLSYSYLRQSGDLSIDRRTFWTARIARIYPAYLLAFILAAPFQIVGSIGVNGLRIALEKLTVGGAMVLALLQAWTPWSAWYWNIPAWSLSVEVFFYFCFPFLAPLFGRLRAKSTLAVAAGLWLLGLAIPLAYSALNHVDFQPPLRYAQLAIETNPLLRLPEFLVGISLGWVFVSGVRFSARAAARLAIVALGACLAVLAISSSIPRPLLSNGFLVPILGLLIFTLAHQSGLLARFLSLPVLKLLGDASYAIYVLQFPIAACLRVVPGQCSFQRFVVYLVVLVLASVLTFFFVEQPLRIRIKQYLSRSVSAPNSKSSVPANAPLTTGQVTA